MPRWSIGCEIVAAVGMGGMGHSGTIMTWVLCMTDVPPRAAHPP
jgi:hypothetical protein